MSNRRTSLAVLAGIALFPFAFSKVRETLAPILADVALLKSHATPVPIPPLTFENGAGERKAFSDFQGKHLLVNVWATWCPPCRKEMPALDRLQAKLGLKAEPEIVAISVDPVSFDQLRAFYSVIGIKNLAIYGGNETGVFQAFGIVGLPTTLLIDHKGREIGRLIGPTAWDAPEILAQLSTLVTGSTGTS